LAAPLFDVMNRVNRGHTRFPMDCRNTPLKIASRALMSARGGAHASNRLYSRSAIQRL